MAVWVLISGVAALLGVSFVACMPVAMVVHELGHAAIARLVGFRVLRIALGSGTPLLQRRWLGVDVVVGRRPFGGCVGVARDELPGWRWRYAAICAGGPLANGLAALGLGTLGSVTPWGALAYALAVANALLLVNLLPIADERSPVPKDGRQISEMLTRDEAFVRARWIAALEHEARAHLDAGRREEARARAEAMLRRVPGSPVANLIVALAALPVESPAPVAGAEGR